MRLIVWVWWTFLAAALALGGFFVWWLVNPSSNYIQVTGYSVAEVDGEWIATSARDLPLGTFTGDWTLTFAVVSPEHAFVCSNDGTDVYDGEVTAPVSYSLSPWADRCLDTMDPVFVTVTRTVRVFFGWVPLRPAVFTFQVLPQGDARAVTGLPPPGTFD